MYLWLAAFISVQFLVSNLIYLHVGSVPYIAFPLPSEFVLSFGWSQCTRIKNVIQNTNFVHSDYTSKEGKGLRFLQRHMRITIKLGPTLWHIYGPWKIKDRGGGKFPLNRSPRGSKSEARHRISLQCMVIVSRTASKSKFWALTFRNESATAPWRETILVCLCLPVSLPHLNAARRKLLDAIASSCKPIGGVCG